jgi:hypothetical protein
MATKPEVIEILKAELDQAAADMVAAVATFRAAWRTAHTADLAIARLGGGEVGEIMEHDQLASMRTPAHSSLLTAQVKLFDGSVESGVVDLMASAKLVELRGTYPEAF